MYDELYVNGMIEIINNGTAIARIFPFDKQVYVKMLLDGMEFETNSISNAKQLIELRVGQ